MFGVPRAHLDQIAVVAGDMVDFEHFGMIGKGLRDAVPGTEFIAPNGDERQQSEAERLGVDLRRIAAKDSTGFELSHALQHGGRRQAHGPGDFDLGFPRVGLEEIENLQIDVV